MNSFDPNIPGLHFVGHGVPLLLLSMLGEVFAQV